MSTDPHSPDQPPPGVQRRRYEVRDIRIRWVVGSLVGFAIFFFAMAAGIYWMLHDFARKTAVRDEPNSVVRPSEVARGGVPYNYTTMDFPQTEAPGISVFARDAAGAIYHTYSTFGRGVEVVMTTYDLLDLVPKGRDEDPDGGMAWLRHHDRYADARATS